MGNQTFGITGVMLAGDTKFTRWENIDLASFNPMATFTSKPSDDRRKIQDYKLLSSLTSNDSGMQDRIEAANSMRDSESLETKSLLKIGLQWKGEPSVACRLAIAEGLRRGDQFCIELNKTLAELNDIEVSALARHNEQLKILRSPRASTN